MLLWKNTKTLDGFIDDIPQTNLKHKADIVLLGSKSISLDEFPELKGIFRVGVSESNVPLDEANKKNIAVAFPALHTKKYIYEETANFTCGLIFNAHYKKIGTISPWIKNNRKALSEKKLLILGEGKIGGLVHEKMKVFLNVMVFDPYRYKDILLEDLLSEADFVSIHIPDIEENINFIDSEKLALMKNDSVLINTSRGRIVSENDLYDELLNKRLYASFDVYWKEPYDGILKEFYPDRFMMTPHVASTCNEFLSGSNKDLRNFIVKLSCKL